MSVYMLFGADFGAMSDPRRQAIGLIYRLHGGLRSLFSGPHVSTGLVLLEAMVLAAVASGEKPPTVSHVARELGYLRQSVQRAMNKLIDLGLVERQPNEVHKSAPVYVLTEQGWERLALVHRPAQILADHLESLFPAKRAQKLVAELKDLHAAIAEIEKLQIDD